MRPGKKVKDESKRKNGRSHVNDPWLGPGKHERCGGTVFFLLVRLSQALLSSSSLPWGNGRDFREKRKRVSRTRETHLDSDRRPAANMGGVSNAAGVLHQRWSGGEVPPARRPGDRLSKAGIPLSGIAAMASRVGGVLAAVG